MAVCTACVGGLSGCAPMPTGPMVTVVPGPNKPFEVFVQEDQLCRGWASHSIGLAGHDEAAQQMLASTIAGAAIGAIAGGHRNAEAGVAMGTVMGASVGVNQSAVVASNAQRQYDMAYLQCMYSKGNLVPRYDGRAFTYPMPAWTPPPPAP